MERRKSEVGDRRSEVVDRSDAERSACAVIAAACACGLCLCVSGWMVYLACLDSSWLCAELPRLGWWLLCAGAGFAAAHGVWHA